MQWQFSLQDIIAYDSELMGHLVLHINKYCHVYYVTVTRGLDWMIVFIDHVYTQLVITSNDNSIAYIHTTTHSTLKSSQSAFTGLYLITAVHNGYSSECFH
jgi:hypothetical protein